MSEVKLAKTAGFCYGVERAVNAVYEEIRKYETEQPVPEQNSKDPGRGIGIYTYGPIVHNDLVVNDLKTRGVGVIDGPEELKTLAEAGRLKGATVIIRAHGVGQDIYELLERPELGIRTVDATCPFVRKIHEIVRQHKAAGEEIIITGTASHPEVQGILGQIKNDAIVIENAQEAADFVPKKEQKYCLVSQTTFNTQKFEDVVDILKKKLYYVDVVNTICNATQLRQKEAAELSRECDAMIVIGGRHSSNTAKLAEICSKQCGETYYIESLEDLKEAIDHQSVRCFGITAGASTPKTIIQEVLKYVRDEF